MGTCEVNTDLREHVKSVTNEVSICERNRSVMMVARLAKLNDVLEMLGLNCIQKYLDNIV